jgi:hypothetical protein
LDHYSKERCFTLVACDDTGRNRFCRVEAIILDNHCRSRFVGVIFTSLLNDIARAPRVMNHCGMDEVGPSDFAQFWTSSAAMQSSAASRSSRSIGTSRWRQVAQTLFIILDACKKRSPSPAGALIGHMNWVRFKEITRDVDVGARYPQLRMWVVLP